LAAGGAEKVLATIANELINEYDIEVIFLEKNEFYELDKRIKKVYLSNFNGKESPIKKFVYLPILALKLKKYIKNHNINLLQSHVYRANYINILAKLLGSKHKTEIVVSGVISFYKKEGFVGKLNLFLIKYLFPKADLIIWKSKGMQYDAIKLFKLNNKQIVINNPNNLNEIAQLSEEKIKDFSFNPNKTYLINIGRMESFKKQEWIIRALKDLNEDIELILIGDGKNRKNLEELAKDLNLSKRVHFLGKKKNPYKYLKRSNIFVLSSDNGEGFPNVIVEALACGVPVIASDCISGPREILFPSSDIRKQLKYNDSFELGDYGILYPIGNTKELGRAIKYLLNNKEIYKNYQAKTSERAKDFSLEKIIEKYKKVLLEEF
jgi:N-acetylgalactosamine-N,N'-diacetylbacillosaminyl-diphospho-undecaprenol 4-alpha-N-acetylgalactosaminyltransferase